jgi:hypothetical protein
MIIPPAACKAFVSVMRSKRNTKLINSPECERPPQDLPRSKRPPFRRNLYPVYKWFWITFREQSRYAESRNMRSARLRHLWRRRARVFNSPRCQSTTSKSCRTRSSSFFLSSASAIFTAFRPRAPRTVGSFICSEKIVSPFEVRFSSDYRAISCGISIRVVRESPTACRPIPRIRRESGSTSRVG